MKPVLYRYKNSESVIPVMDGYTPGEGWEPLYSQDQISSAVNAALKATAPDERVKELEAELAAAEIAIAEYRQQCLDNAAEIARLRSESEERLQNCAALVAEVERLRAEVTRPESTDMTLMRALVQSQATELERLRKDAERYRWIKSAKGLTLESERGGPWTRENGGTFTPSHRLCAGGTQFAPYETLDDAIDAAMKGTP